MQQYAEPGAIAMFAFLCLIVATLWRLSK